MFEYLFAHVGEVNASKLKDELKAQIAAVDAANTRPGAVLVLATVALSGQEQTTAQGIIDAHNPAPTSNQQAQIDGAVQLAGVLSNHQDLLIYADYFFRLQKALITLWKTKPNLTDTTSAVYTALRGGKATTAEITNPNDLAMYNTFLWHIQRTTSLALVSGDLPAVPNAAQAQIINSAAYQFMGAGVTLALMLMKFS